MTTDGKALRAVLEELAELKAEIAAEAEEAAKRTALVSGKRGIPPSLMTRAAKAAGQDAWLFEAELLRIDGWRIVPVRGLDSWVGCEASPLLPQRPGEPFFEAAASKVDPAADYADEEVPDDVVEQAAAASSDWDRYYADLAMPGEWERRQLVRGRVLREVDN